MSCLSSASVLLLCAIISQAKEYDCPEFDANLCAKYSTFEYRDTLECTSDNVCGIRQKCCNNCKYRYKICTDVAVRAFLTKQDLYLKNKYCPKVNLCVTPLKYNATYRCWSDEGCRYGYKCCKSDCYIHKVCVIPIHKEGVEAVPPPTTEEEKISIVVTTSTKSPKTTLFVRPGETLPIIASSRQTTVSPTVSIIFHETSTKIQETTRGSTEFVASGDGLTDDDGDDDGDDIGSGYSEDTEKPQPITGSSRQTTVSLTATTILQETSTKIQETTRGSTAFVASGDGLTDDDGDDDGDDIGSGYSEDTEKPQPITGSSRQTTVSLTATTILQETSTKIQETTRGSTAFAASGDGLTDDDGDDDGDDIGSGHTEDTKRPRPITGSSRQTTVSPTVATILQENSTKTQETTRGSTAFVASGDGVTDDDDGENIGSGHTEDTQKPRPITGSSRQTTVSPTVTTIVQEISTKIQETTRGSTAFVASGDGLTDDDGDDDGDDTGSGYSEDTERPRSITGSSRQTTVSPTVTTVLQETSTKTQETTRGSTAFVASGDGLTDDDGDDDGDDIGSGYSEDTEKPQPITGSSRQTTVSLTATTILQETSTKIQETTRGSTAFIASGDGLTDDDDGDDIGSGHTEDTKRPRPITGSSRQTTVSLTATTILQETSTKIQETTRGSTAFVASGDGLTDDDDGDDIGSGHTEDTKRPRPITGSSRQTTVSPTVTTIVQKTQEATRGSTAFVASGDGLTDDDGDDIGSGYSEDIERPRPITGSSRQTTVSPTAPTIFQETSTKIQEKIRGSTAFVASGDGLTDDDGDDDGDDIGSGYSEDTERPRPVMASSRGTTVSPTVTTIIETSTKIKEATQGSTELLPTSFTNHEGDNWGDIHSGHIENTGTPRSFRTSSSQATVSPTITTVDEDTSTKIQNTSQGSTESASSGDIFTRDNEDDDTAIGNGATTAAIHMNVTATSKFWKIIRTVKQRTSEIFKTTPSTTEFTTNGKDATSEIISNTTKFTSSKTERAQTAVPSSADFTSSADDSVIDDDDADDNDSGSGNQVDTHQPTSNSHTQLISSTIVSDFSFSDDATSFTQSHEISPQLTTKTTSMSTEFTSSEEISTTRSEITPNTTKFTSTKTEKIQTATPSLADVTSPEDNSVTDDVDADDDGSETDVTSSRDGSVTDDDDAEDNGSGSGNQIDTHQPTSSSHSQLTSSTIGSHFSFSEEATAFTQSHEISTQLTTKATSMSTEFTNSEENSTTRASEITANTTKFTSSKTEKTQTATPSSTDVTSSGDNSITDDVDADDNGSGSGSSKDTTASTKSHETPATYTSTHLQKFTKTQSSTAAIDTEGGSKDALTGSTTSNRETAHPDIQNETPTTTTKQQPSGTEKYSDDAIVKMHILEEGSGIEFNDVSEDDDDDDSNRDDVDEDIRNNFNHAWQDAA